MAVQDIPTDPEPGEAPAEKLTLWQKIGYGLGDIYGGGSGVVISFYYLVFLTDVIRIRPALAGTVILISKIYDSITDPLEGVIADRTRTPLGRRRPYLLAGIVLIFLSFFALFYPVGFESETGRFVFVLLTYLFFSTVVSIVMLNYNALQAELTLDYNERTSLSSYRIFFSTVSSIAAAVLPLEIVGRFADVRTGWIVMAASFGIFFALPFIATVAATREREAFQQPPEPVDTSPLWKNLLKPHTTPLAGFAYVAALLAIIFFTTNGDFGKLANWQTWALIGGIAVVAFPLSNFIIEIFRVFGYLDALKIRAFRYTLLMYLFAFVAIDTVGSLVIFFMKNYLGRVGETNFVSGTLLVSQVAVLLIFVWLSRRTSKRTGYIVGAFIWMGAMFLSFLIAPGQPSFAIYVFAAIVGFGTGGIVVMIYAIFPDIPDVDELLTGERREGMYSALWTFARKLSSAVALFLVAQALDWAGYIPPVEQVIEGATRLVEQPQPAIFVLTLRLLFAFIPIILLAFTLIYAFRFPLTPEIHARLNRLLSARRADQHSPELDAEAEALKELLI